MAEPTTESAGLGEAGAAPVAPAVEPTGTIGEAAPLVAAETKSDAIDAGKADEQGEEAKKAAADKEAADKQAEEAAKASLYSDIKDLQLPEGTFVDEAAGKEFSEILTKLKVDKPTAQKLADLNLKVTSQTVTNLIQKMTAQADAELKTWNEEIENDKTLGGANLPVTKQTADKLIEFAGTVPGVNVQRFRQALLKSNMSNQPDMVRVAYHLGKMIGNDQMFIADRASGGPRKSDAEVLFGGSAK